MSTSKSFQNQQTGFVSYRPNSPKLTGNSPTSINTNQNQTITNLQQRAKQNSQVEPDHFATIRHENSLLREENKALKRELNLVKGQFLINQNISNNQTHSHEVNDLRETIKKEAGEIKELKTRLEVVTKQCKMYEEIIGKMEGKINKLTDQNKQLEQKVKESRISERHEKEDKNEEQSRYNKQKFGILVQKVNQIATLYNQLESKVQLSEQEWELWKDQWGKEKVYYLNRIRDLEGMMGIGVQAKEFYKKRY